MAEPAVLVNSKIITHFQDFLMLAMNVNVSRLLSYRSILLEGTRPHLFHPGLSSSCDRSIETKPHE